MAASDLFDSRFSDDEKEDLAGLFQRVNRDTAFRDARTSVRRLENIFNETGVEAPPEDDSPGFVSRFLDVLDTPKQLLQGAGAALFDIPGFENDSLFEGAKRGAAEDITSGEILRRLGVFNPEDDDNILERGGRFVTSVGLDVLTDPLTFLSGPGNFAAKVAGRGKNLKASIKTKEGVASLAELELRRGAQVEKEVLGSLTERAAKGEVPEKFLEAQITRAKTEAERRVGQDLAVAAKLVKDNRLIPKIGAGDEAVRELALNTQNIDERLAYVKNTFGLADETTVDDLEEFFVDPAITFSSPFAGVKALQNIPLLGTRQADIPIITPASAATFKYLGGHLYNLKNETGIALNKAARMEGLAGAPFRLLRQSIDKTKELGTVFSRATQVGGEQNKRILDEVDIANAGAKGAAESITDELFESAVPLSELDRKRMTVTLDTLRASRLNAKGERVKKATIQKDRAVVRDQASFDAASKKMVADFDAELPGKGAEAKRITDLVDSEWQRYADENIADGNIHSALEGYLAITTKKKNGTALTEQELRSLAATLSKDADFGKHRQFIALGDAVTSEKGYIFETDLKKIFAARTEAQLKARANRRFHERLAFEVGISPTSKLALEKALISNNVRVQNKAAQIAEAQGIRFDDMWYAQPSAAEKGIRELLPLRDSVGKQLPPEAVSKLISEYDNLIEAGGKATEVVREAKRVGFDVTNKASRAEALGKATEDWNALVNNIALPRGVFRYIRDGKNGPILTANRYDDLLLQSGQQVEKAGELVPSLSSQKAKRFLEKAGLAGRDPAVVRQELLQAEEVFNKSRRDMAYLGRGGEAPLERAGLKTISEAVIGKETLKRLPKKDQLLYSNYLPDYVAGSIAEAKESKLFMENWKKKAAKGDPMAAALVNIVDPWLGLVKVHKILSTQLWPGYITRNVGGAQVQMMESASILGEALNIPQIIKSYNIVNKGAAGEFIQEGTGRVLKFGQLRQEIRDFGGEITAEQLAELVKGQNANLAYRGTGKIAKGFEKVKNFNSLMENVGRNHLYMRLRIQGMDPTEAVTTMSRVMVDYARGKTKVEQNVMNNLIFFYSFARGSASNTLTQVIRKPGALTAQLHLIDGVREALMNEDGELDRDVVKEMETLRSKETVSRYLGTNKEGVDQLLATTGVPVEELSRFINIHLPKEATASAFMDAAGETLRRTAQSTISSLNPPMRGVFEYLGANKNFFFDRPLNAKVMRRFPQFEKSLEGLLPFASDSIPLQAWEKVDDGLKQILKGRSNGDGTITIDPTAMAVMSYVIPGASRAVSTGNFLAKKGDSTQQKWLRLMTGIRITDVDKDAARVFQRKEELEQALNAEFGTTSRKKIRQQLATDSEE